MFFTAVPGWVKNQAITMVINSNPKNIRCHFLFMLSAFAFFYDCFYVRDNRLRRDNIFVGESSCDEKGGVLGVFSGEDSPVGEFFGFEVCF